MAEPMTVPLSPWQRRDVEALQTQAAVIQHKLDMIARTVIAGHGIDPDTLGGASVDLSRPDVGIVITPALQLMREA